jgi:hypothetical protein
MAKQATDINKFHAELDKHLVKARQMGMNRAIVQLKTEVARVVRSKYNVRLSDVRNMIVAKKLSKANDKANMYVKHTPISLINFGARMTSKGVTYSIIKGKRELRRDAFIINVSSDQKQVFQRVGKKGERRTIKKGRYKDKHLKRQKINKQLGKSVAEMFIGKSGKQLEPLVRSIFMDKSAVEINRALVALRRGYSK